jgi:hypothetical protein
VFIGSADIDNVFGLHFQVANIDTAGKYAPAT